MQNAKTILAILQERGTKGLPLERVYRHLFNPDLYLMAYGKIYRNAGAMTPGNTSETVDEMSLAKIEAIITALRSERYRWTPTRRVYIEKKHSTKMRSLSIPTWSDKLLQEVIRLLLEAYYEPQFSPHSHGFRPGKGCHTALEEIDHNWTGTTWFIEGDIRACFDSLSQDILLALLSQQIHDGRFLRLIRELLQAGYLEDWKYHATHSGAPQGGIVSPVLSNIYLDQLDRFVEMTLIPHYHRGTRHQSHTAYHALISQASRLRKAGKREQANAVYRTAQRLPSINPKDETYRRLRYVRYADDWLIGFTGPKEEAEAIKIALQRFLQEELALDLSMEKTKITHARTQAARFLGYDISTSQEDRKRTHRRRSINGRVRLTFPTDILKQKCQKYLKRGKPIHRPELTTDTAYSIVSRYQAEYRGVVQYYQLADNLGRMSTLKWVMEQSLTKTLASKYKISVPKVYERYQAIITTGGRTYKGLQVIIPRQGKKPLIAKWGGIPLRKKQQAILNDQPPMNWVSRSELEKRMLADTCELCGSHDRINIHHIRALKDVHPKGRREKPPWMQVMAARKRKTLVVCWTCHMNIHHGRLTRQIQPLKSVSLESRIPGNS